MFLHTLDLQFFADEEDFNLDQFQQEFESEWTETDEEPTETSEEVDETPSPDAETDETPDEPEDESESQEPKDEPVEQPPSEEDKRNRAFADLRRTAEENKKYAEFVKQVAEQSGATPEEVMKRFEERRLEQEAEKQQVPVDVLKRLNSLESQNRQLEEGRFAERFNSQVEQTIQKYKASESQIQDTFKYMRDNGINPKQSSISFEAVYKMAHMDSIIEQQVESARQKDLEEKKKRQESSAIPSGNSVSQSDELTDEYIDKELERMGIRI